MEVEWVDRCVTMPRTSGSEQKYDLERARRHEYKHLQETQELEGTRGGYQANLSKNKGW